MKSFAEALRKGCLYVVFAWIVLVTGGVPASGAAEPRIRAIEHRGTELLIHVIVPPGVARVALEGCRRSDLTAWIPRATTRVEASGVEITFTLPVDGETELFRVRVDSNDPLPAAWYTGRTGTIPQPASDPAVVRAGGGIAEDAAPGQAEGGAGLREVAESDIWAMRGDTLYFFNEQRGFQVIDVTRPEAPLLKSTYRLPGSGEQMYLVGDRHVALLAHDPCRQWATDAESAVWILDTSVSPPADVARLSLTGRIVESRRVGSALYVATESWEPQNDGSGTWRAGTRLYGFDLSKPENPVGRGTLWFRGSGNVVAATDTFFFVGVTDYSKPWPWRSDLEVVDITSSDGYMANWARLSLAGRIPDKFKIDLHGDVLRVVVEAVESAETWRFVTVLETYRLSDPRLAVPLAVLRLDRLELARGERLHATRFDGDRAYVVTFERVDPLWVVDLSNPSDIRVAGELEIPGWSTYLRPMGSRLLALGVDDASGSRVAVQLFDVSNPAKPALLAKVPLGENSSWSEANVNEKALGVFPDAGLLLVPISEWRNDRLVSGVQLVDMGPDSLTRRGLLRSDAVVPRRAFLHRDKVFALSGRSLVSAEIGDRDEPSELAELELAYPVERVVFAGNLLLEFQAGAIRIRDPRSVETLGSVALGDAPLLGAVVRDGDLHLLQGRGAEVAWDYDSAGDVWTSRTNAGKLTASVWSLAALPNLSKTSETTWETSQAVLSDAEPRWLDDGLLVWITGSGFGRPWVAERGEAAVGITDPIRGGGLWRPWWGRSTRAFFALQVSGNAAPLFLSETLLGGDGVPEGDVFVAGSRLFASEEVTESEVIGTHTVVESVWFPTGPQEEIQIVKGPDGTVRTNVISSNSGEWRAVTNQYPALRWWSRHELRVVDYGRDAARPVMYPAVPLGGALLGVRHGGNLLVTTAWRAQAPSGARMAWLEASAFDGVKVHQLDAVPLADESRSEAFTGLSAEDRVYVMRGGWAADAKQRMETWRLDQDGKWVRSASLTMTMPPGEMARFGDVLLARNGGDLALVDIRDPDAPRELVAAPAPGCFSGDVRRGDGDGLRGVWLPLWEYGAFRVGP